jgi:hypothetical protein
MSDSATTIPPGNGPWRVLILDTSGDDPKWLLCTITLASDVRTAVMDGRRYRDWPAVTEWVRGQAGRPVSLVPIAAMAWRIDEGQPR